jgi:hypothetical protein
MSWIRGQQFWAYYTAWDTVVNSPKTADKANHTIKISKDGGAAATATNNGHASNHVELANGEYAILLTATEATCDSLNVFGVSSSTGIVLIPFRVTLLRLPNVDPGISGGLPTTNSNNQVAIQPDAGALHSGTAQAGAASTLTLASGASSITDLYKGNLLKITSGMGAGQTRAMTAYNGSTKVATVDWNWTTPPDNTSVYAVLPADGPSVNSALHVSTTASDPWSTALPGSYGAGTAGKLIGDNVNATISSRAAAGDQMALTNAAADLVRTRQMTEGYAALGVVPTMEQCLLMLLQLLQEFSISGTTITTKKLDQTTTAMVHELDDPDDASSRTRMS